MYNQERKPRLNPEGRKQTSADDKIQSATGQDFTLLGFLEMFLFYTSLLQAIEATTRLPKENSVKVAGMMVKIERHYRKRCVSLTAESSQRPLGVHRSRQLNGRAEIRHNGVLPHFYPRRTSAPTPWDGAVKIGSAGGRVGEEKGRR